VRNVVGPRFGNNGEVADALSAFDPIWEALSTQEQGRVIQLLVERVDYAGKNGKVAVTFHPAGIMAFAEQFETK
jgi:site-specific DNA recombinase